MPRFKAGTAFKIRRRRPAYAAVRRLGDRAQARGHRGGGEEDDGKEGHGQGDGQEASARPAERRPDITRPDAVCFAPGRLSSLTSAAQVSRCTFGSAARPDPGRFAIYPPKGKKYCVLVLHPTAGINIAWDQGLAAEPKVHLLTWAALVSELGPEPGAKQTASLSTQVRAQDGYPEINLAQYWSDLKNEKPTNVFGFTHVPPIWTTSISRDIAEPDGRNGFECSLGEFAARRIAPHSTSVRFPKSNASG